MLYPDDGGVKILRNGENYLKIDTVSYLRILAYENVISGFSVELLFSVIIRYRDSMQHVLAEAYRAIATSG